MQSSWRQPALMALRGLRSAVSSGHTLHIHRAVDCLWSVIFHSSRNSGETVLELCAYCTAPLHPPLCSSVPFRPFQAALSSNSSQGVPWNKGRSSAALPWPEAAAPTTAELCDWSRNGAAGDELWGAQGALRTPRGTAAQYYRDALGLLWL